MLNDILGETYEIRLAGSGREALEILEKEHWNLESGTGAAEAGNAGY